MTHRPTLAVAFALAAIALASPAAGASGPGGFPAPTDQRSPDARDAARGPASHGPSFRLMTAPERRRSVHHTGGVEWNDVALIGGGMTTLVLVGLGTAGAIRRRDAARRDSAVVASG